MGTRSLIGEPHGDSMRARYVHWDGYPSHMGASLLRIVQRDGLGATRQRLLHDRYGWSNIDPDQEYAGSPFIVEAGYGQAYDDCLPDDWYAPGQDLGGTEWAYVLADAALLVGKVRGDDVEWITMVLYDAAEVDWAAVTDQGYAAVRT